MAAPIRRISAGKTILFSILTFGIYYLVQVFKMSSDLHQNQEGGTKSWQVLFWLGLVFAIPMYILYVLNFIQAKNLRERNGIPESGTGVASVIFLFVPVIPLLAQFLWNAYYNALASDVGQATGGAVPSPTRN